MQTIEAPFVSLPPAQIGAEAEFVNNRQPELPHSVGVSVDGFMVSSQPFQHCGTLNDGRFRVEGSFVITYSTDGDTVVAAAEEFGEYGYGENRHQALLDLQKTLVELFFTLKQSPDRLGPDLQKTWGLLQGRFVLRADEASRV